MKTVDRKQLYKQAEYEAKNRENIVIKYQCGLHFEYPHFGTCFNDKVFEELEYLVERDGLL